MKAYDYCSYEINDDENFDANNIKQYGKNGWKLITSVKTKNGQSLIFMKEKN